MQGFLRQNKIDELNIRVGYQTNKAFTPDRNICSHRFDTAVTIRYTSELSSENRIEIAHVRSFAFLKKNWDSYGAASIDMVAVEKAVDFIKLVDKFDVNVYLTSPGPNGEVMVQLKDGSRETEFIFYSDKDKYVLFDNNEFVKQGPYTHAILPEMIQWLTT